MKIRFIDIEFAQEAGRYDKMEVEIIPSWFGVLFGRRAKQVKVLGDGILWYYADGTGRCNTAMSLILYELWKFVRFQRGGVRDDEY